MTRQLAQRDYHKLKSLTKRLIVMSGGCEQAAEITRVRKSNLSDYGHHQKMDLFAPIDVIADLETEIGEPLVSRQLMRLVEENTPPSEPICQHAIPSEGAKVTVANGRFQEATLRALEDKDVNNGELEELIQIAETKMRAAAELHDKLCALRESRRGEVTPMRKRGGAG